MKRLITAALGAFLATSAFAQNDAGQQILFTNCNVFDGVADSLVEGRNVLVEGNLIASIGDASVTAESAEVIDCEGRTLSCLEITQCLLRSRLLLGN